MSKKRWILLALVLVICGSGYGLYSWWQAQSSTSLVQYGPQNSSDVLGSATRLVDWQTAYFSTRVTSALRQTSAIETPGEPIIGSYLLDSTSPNNNSQLAVTIGNLSGYSLNETSAVKLRLSQPGNYSPTSRSYAPPGALAFSGTASYETSVFWQHNAQYVAVVVSGTSDHKADLEQSLSDVVSNWQWK